MSSARKNSGRRRRLQSPRNEPRSRRHRGNTDPTGIPFRVPSAFHPWPPAVINLQFVPCALPQKPGPGSVVGRRWPVLGPFWTRPGAVLATRCVCLGLKQRPFSGRKRRAHRAEKISAAAVPKSNTKCRKSQAGPPHGPNAQSSRFLQETIITDEH
jgi:hypothetical protein